MRIVIAHERHAPPHTGKLILETASTLSKAPDGNGGVYMALHSSGVLDKLESLGARITNLIEDYVKGP